MFGGRGLPGFVVHVAGLWDRGLRAHSCEFWIGVLTFWDRGLELALAGLGEAFQRLDQD